MEFENIAERELLVDKLVERVKFEYELLFHFYLSNLSSSTFNSTLIRLGMFLLWIKEQIIDNNGVFFRRFKEADLNLGIAIYWVLPDEIKCLLNEDGNIFANIYGHFIDIKSDVEAIGFLASISETNIGSYMVNDIDMVMYHKKTGVEEE